MIYICKMIFCKQGVPRIWLSYVCILLRNIHSFKYSLLDLGSMSFVVAILLETSIVTSCIRTERNSADDKQVVAFSQNIHLESSVLRWKKKLRQYRVPVKMSFTVNRPVSMVFINFAFAAQFCQSRTRIGTSVITVNNNRDCFVLEYQLSSTLSTDISWRAKDSFNWLATFYCKVIEITK